jgi:hypothetical protein
MRHIVLLLTMGTHLALKVDTSQAVKALAEMSAGKSNPLLNLPHLHRHVDLAGILE